MRRVRNRSDRPASPTPGAAAPAATPWTRDSYTRLRKRAERSLLGAAANDPGLADLDVRRLFGELEVREVELRLQNDELVETERALEETARRYAELFEEAPVAYVILDATGRILSANGSAAALLRTAPGGLAGRALQAFVPQDALPGFDLALAAALGSPGREKVVHELPLRPEDGSGLFVRLEAVASPGGRTCRAALLDMSDTRRREDELRRAKVEAEAANRAKSDFLAKMSHEIRTPLSGVLGMIDLALLGELPARGRQHLSMAKQSAQSLVRIVNDLLDLARIEAHRLVLESAPFQVGRLLDSVLAIHEPGARSKGLAVNVSVSEKVPAAVVGDEGRLRQVLGNLVGNAVKFTDRGEVAVAVSVRPAPSAPDGQGRIVLVFAVRDTGSGIAPGALPTIFDTFVQAGRPSAGGAGLGLAVARQLVELMGGRISVESAPGLGSTFRFEVELGARSAPRPAALPATPAVVAAPQVRHRVLLAEDDEVNAAVALEYLRLLGHEPSHVGDGRAALEALEGGSFDVVLMDVSLPVLGGLEALAVVRRGDLAGCPSSIPAIAISAHAGERDRARFLSAGMDDFLPKPFDVAQLDAAIRRVTGGRRPGAP